MLLEGIRAETIRGRQITHLHNATQARLLQLHSAILDGSAVAVGKVDAQRLGLAEQGAGIEAQLLGRRLAIAVMAAKGIGDHRAFHRLQRHALG